MTIFNVCDLPTLFLFLCLLRYRAYERLPARPQCLCTVSMLFAISALQYRPYELRPPHPRRLCCSLFRPAMPTATLPFASLFRPPPANHFLFHSVCFSFPIRLSVRTRRRLSIFLGTLNVICIVPIGIALMSPCRLVVAKVTLRTYILCNRGYSLNIQKQMFYAGRSLYHGMFSVLQSLTRQ